MNENIVRFDISMHYVGTRKDFKGLDDLSKVYQCFLLGKRTFFLKQFIEGTAVAILVHKVEVVCCFKHVNVLHYVGA